MLYHRIELSAEIEIGEKKKLTCVLKLMPMNERAHVLCSSSTLEAVLWLALFRYFIPIDQRAIR